MRGTHGLALTGSFGPVEDSRTVGILVPVPISGFVAGKEASMSTRTPNQEHPVVVRTPLDACSRWLCLGKWLLLLPHYIVLLFLDRVRAVHTVVAFFAILSTGDKHPAATRGDAKW